MTSAKNIYGSFRAAERRSKLAILVALAAALSLLLIVLPAIAGSGGPTGADIQPDEVSYGGGSGACSANLPGLPSAAPYELHINNPSDGTYTGPDGTQVTIDVRNNDRLFDFEFINKLNNSVFDVVVNGGSKNTHFDYDKVGKYLRADTGLHAPTKNPNGGPLFKLSHINICYGVKPFADLSVTKSPRVTTANVGDVVEFEIVVANAGPAAASGIEVTDSLPAGVAFESASDGGTYNSGKVTWSGLSIASSQSKTLSVSVEILRAAGGTDLFNDVAITDSDQEDDDLSDNEFTSSPAIEVSEPVADLSVTKVPVGQEDGDFVANVGDEVTFEIVVFNSSTSTITSFDVKVTDTLPPGMDYKSASDSGSHTNGVVTWEIDSLPIGQSAKLTLVVTINEDAAGQVVKNGVSVSAPDDPEGDNNDDAISIPPVTVTADVGGTKFHDRDTDGGLDPTEEEGLNGWTIAAFDAEGNMAGSAVTDTVEVEPGVFKDGVYTIPDLRPGDYTICEATNTSGLPTDGSGFVWAWAQSEPENELCADYVEVTNGHDGAVVDGYELAGYSVTVDDDIVDIDFGNHIQAAITCDSEVTLSLGGTNFDDNPFAVVTIPGKTPSCSGGLVWLATFDLGLSEDGDDWNQFVAFSGLETNDPTVMDLEIQWDSETAVYDEGNLVVDTTQISLELPANPLNLSDIVLCNTLPGGDPFIDEGTPANSVPICLDSRTIDEGGSLPAGQIQVTDLIKFLGDPGYFR